MSPSNIEQNTSNLLFHEEVFTDSEGVVYYWNKLDTSLLDKFEKINGKDYLENIYNKSCLSETCSFMPNCIEKIRLRCGKQKKGKSQDGYGPDNKLTTWKRNEFGGLDINLKDYFNISGKTMDDIIYVNPRIYSD